jgi:hypothetical protein
MDPPDWQPSVLATMPYHTKYLFLLKHYTAKYMPTDHPSLQVDNTFLSLKQCLFLKELLKLFGHFKYSTFCRAQTSEGKKTFHF